MTESTSEGTFLCSSCGNPTGSLVWYIGGGYFCRNCVEPSPNGYITLGGAIDGIRLMTPVCGPDAGNIYKVKSYERNPLACRFCHYQSLKMKDGVLTCLICGAQSMSEYEEFEVKEEDEGYVPFDPLFVPRES